jgi:hypothetical protein
MKNSKDPQMGTANRWIKPFAILLLIVSLLFSYAVNLVFVGTTLNSLHDFGSFIAAGKLADRGENPYSTDSPFVFHVTFKGVDLSGDAPNLNPPISVPIFKLLASADPFLAINLWRILSVILFAVSLFLLQRNYKLAGFKGFLRIAWAISLAGVWHTLQLGQLYCLLLLFTVLAYIFLDQKREILAGVMLGLLIALKPNFILWALLLLAARRWKVFLFAGLTGLLASVIPLFTNGITIYSQWLEASSRFTPNLLVFPGNNSFQGLTARIWHPEAGIILGIIITFGALWQVYKNKVTVSYVNALGIILSLLVSPIAWTGYTILTLPIFLEKRYWNWMYYLTAGIFAVPVVIILNNFKTSYSNFILWGWFYGWGLMVLLAAIVFVTSGFKGKNDAKISNNQTN